MGSLHHPNDFILFSIYYHFYHYHFILPRIADEGWIPGTSVWSTLLILSIIKCITKILNLSCFKLYIYLLYIVAALCACRYKTTREHRKLTIAFYCSTITIEFYTRLFYPQMFTKESVRFYRFPKKSLRGWPVGQGNVREVDGQCIKYRKKLSIIRTSRLNYGPNDILCHRSRKTLVKN